MLRKEKLMTMGDVNQHMDFLPHVLVGHCVDFGQEDMEQMGVYPGYLFEHGLSLVVYQWDIEFFQGNIYGRSIEEVTFSKLRRNMFFLRYFGFYDQGKLLARACGRWIILDKKDRKMTQVPEILAKKSAQEEKFLQMQGKDLLDMETTGFYLEEEGTSKERVWEVLPHHIDVNGHINNRVFPAFAYDRLGFLFHAQHRLKRMKITYHKEEKKSAKIREAFWMEDKKISNHRFLSQDGELLASLQYQWEERRKE